MMSLETIQSMSRQAAVKAAKEQRVPLVLDEGDVAHFQENPGRPGFTLPNLGDYRPKGFKLVRELFCDTSGMGSPGEPALTVAQFAKEVKPGFGYATLRAGQFQCYVGEFKVVRPTKG